MPPLRRLTHDLAPEAARAILAGLDATLELAGVARLHGGSTEVYRLDLAGDAPPLVVKLYPEEPVWSPGKEALVAKWIGDGLDFPTPRWLALDESRKILPLRYAVTSWLPGAPIREHMGEAGAHAAFVRMGELLRRLHEIPMAAFGYILDHGIERPAADNATYMADAFEHAFAWFGRQGGDADLARRLEQVVAERIEVLAPCKGPVFCHDDFQPGNVLAAPDDAGGLRLTGLLDFGNARAGDPLMDLAKSMFCCGHEHAPSLGPLRAGYGPIDHPDPETAIWLYLLFHRVIMWAYLKGFGNPGEELLRDLADMMD